MVDDDVRLSLLFFCGMCLVGCSGDTQPIVKGNSKDGYRVDEGSVDKHYFLYNQEFSNRFELPENGVINLSKGLLAIGLNIVGEPGKWDSPTCSLKLYVNSALDIAYPSSERADFNHWLPGSSAGFFITDELPEVEKEWVDHKHIDKSFNTVQIASKKLDSNGVPKNFSDTGMSQYDTEYLQGIAYFSTDVLCATLIEENLPYELYVKKDTYKGINGPYTAGYDLVEQSESIYRFNIPNRLIYAALPIIQKQYQLNSDWENKLKSSNKVKPNQNFDIPPLINFQR